jgi:hypothetical protein
MTRNRPLSQEFTNRHRRMGILTAWAVFLVGVLYAVTLIAGLVSLKSPDDPIDDPYFTLLELLIIIMAPLLVIVMVTVHAYARAEVKAYSLVALAFMTMAAAITSCVHFVILTVSRSLQTSAAELMPLFLSFKWPSIVYAMDILAWDIFFALAMLFAAPVFRGGRFETSIRLLMFSSGVLSLAGLIGVPLANMQVRMIGVLGYAALPPVIFLLLAQVYRRSQ